MKCHQKPIKQTIEERLGYRERKKRHIVSLYLSYREKIINEKQFDTNHMKIVFELCSEHKQFDVRRAIADIY